MKLLKIVRIKLCFRYIRMKRQQGIGGFLRKRQEIRNQAEKFKEKTAGKKVKKKVKKIVKKSVLNKKENKVKV